MAVLIYWVIFTGLMLCLGTAFMHHGGKASPFPVAQRFFTGLTESATHRNHGKGRGCGLASNAAILFKAALAGTPLHEILPKLRRRGLIERRTPHSAI